MDSGHDLCRVTRQSLRTQDPGSRVPPWHRLPPTQKCPCPHAPTHAHPKPPCSAPLAPDALSPGLYSRSPILAKCNLLTQEILLRGLGVMKTTMKLMGRPDLRREGEECEGPELAPCCCLRHGHRPWHQLRSEHHCDARKAGAPAKPLSPGGRVPPPTMAVSPQSHRAMLPSPVPHPPAWCLVTREALPGLPSQFSSGLTRHTCTSDRGASARRNGLPSACSQRPVSQCGCSANVCRMDM